LGAAVLHIPTRDHLELVDQRFDGLSAVALDETDGDIGAPQFSTAGLVEHGEGLPDPRRSAQVDAEPSGVLDRVGSRRIIGLAGSVGLVLCRGHRRTGSRPLA
jgi:hypothetical protein